MSEETGVTSIARDQGAMWGDVPGSRGEHRRTPHEAVIAPPVYESDGERHRERGPPDSRLIAARTPATTTFYWGIYLIFSRPAVAGGAGPLDADLRS